MERPCPRCGNPNDRYPQPYCRLCHNANQRERKRRPDERLKINARQRRRYRVPSVRLAKNASNQRQREKPVAKFKRQAQSAISNAIRDGHLTRGLICQICNEPSQEAHHQDYTKPLEVIWLCRRCHKLTHRNMYTTDETGAVRVRWEVLWTKGDRILNKEFDHDLVSALELRDKLIAGGRANVTLRSMNAGFPPPDKYADHDGGSLIEPRTYQHRMGLINLKGLWWCCYCLKLRRFIKTDCFVIDGLQVDEPAMSCPLCGASNRLNTIQRYNPKSNRYTESLRRTRSDKGSSR